MPCRRFAALFPLHLSGGAGLEDGEFSSRTDVSLRPQLAAVALVRLLDGVRLARSISRLPYPPGGIVLVQHLQLRLASSSTAMSRLLARDGRDDLDS